MGGEANHATDATPRFWQPAKEVDQLTSAENVSGELSNWKKLLAHSKKVFRIP